jgi:hypothetical protein
MRNDYPYVIEFFRLPNTRRPGANGFAFAPLLPAEKEAPWESQDEPTTDVEDAAGREAA